MSDMATRKVTFDYFIGGVEIIIESLFVFG